jgi:hypothetical protein
VSVTSGFFHLKTISKHDFFALEFFCAFLQLYSLVKFIQSSKKPRVHDVRIIEITSEPYEYASNISQRNVPHAKVEYYHQSVKHEKKILLKSKAKSE